MTQPHQTRVMSAFEPAASQQPNPAALRAAADWLAEGEPVVIPTETVYGLAARALDRGAVARVFAIKGRPLDNPLIAHVTGPDQLELLGADLTPLAERLIRRFWPGPLTLVLHTRRDLPWITAGLSSIALRAPAHEFARALIRETGPLAAPSANLSGLPSPTRAAHALADLSGRVPLVVDGGDLQHGLESTVIDARGETPVLLRPGAVSVEELRVALDLVVDAAPAGAVARSPGMKYRHYSPRAEVWLYPPSGGSATSFERLSRDAARLAGEGQRVAVIAKTSVAAARFIRLPDDSREIARKLFIWLRELDDAGAQRILIEGVSPEGIGRAVMDRLERAATRIIDVDCAGLPKESIT